MLNRLPASLGLALAAFAATTGVSQAAIDTRSEVMYVAGAAVVVFLILVSIAYAVANALGLIKYPPIEPDETDRGIRSSGFGEAAFDAAHAHEHTAHATHDDGGHDDHGSHAPAAASAHH
jgi:hypothetical protein